MTQPSLPEMTIPIFPLEGALLLPGGDLPLNIFEPRYLAMTKAAMAGDRIIGMIQPCPASLGAAACLMPFYTVGCAGHIAECHETPDGRYLITLHGVSRFELVRHRVCTGGYREADVSFARFADDTHAPLPLSEPFARAHLVDRMNQYLLQEGLTIDWQVAEQIPDHRFYTLLSMICPFTPVEKQALLEATTFEDRCRVMKCLMDIACAEQGGASSMERPC